MKLARADVAVEFAAYLVKTCVIEEAGVSSTEFYNVIDALSKVIGCQFLSFGKDPVEFSGSAIVICNVLQ